MADIVHGRNDLTAATAARSVTAKKPAGPITTVGEKPPRTDVGTLVLHWATAIAFTVSLFTGIRIAADALNAPISK